MTRGIPATVAAAAAGARRELSGLVLAATLRTVRDLDIAEEATADAFLLALQAWTQSGIPDSVQAWLITAARRRAIDRVRRAQADRRALMRESGGWSGVVAGTDDVAEAAVVGDDELRLVVLCCVTRGLGRRRPGRVDAPCWPRVVLDRCRSPAVPGMPPRPWQPGSPGPAPATVKAGPALRAARRRTTSALVASAVDGVGSAWSPSPSGNIAGSGPELHATRI